MQRLVISSSQMCISREQEDFLAAYRTDEAWQLFIDSYGKEKVDFLNSGFDGDNSLPIFNPFEILSFNGVAPGGEGPLYREVNRIVFSNIVDFSNIDSLFVIFNTFSTRISVTSWIPTIYRNTYDIKGAGSALGFQVASVGLIDKNGVRLHTVKFITETNVLLPEEFLPIITL